jgi:hypothetical protein
MASKPVLGYEVHLANYGWKQGVVFDGMATGTVGLSLSMQAIRVYGLPPGFQYRAHVGNRGWLDWVGPSEIAGTVGQSLGLQALQFRYQNPKPGQPLPLVYGHVHVGFEGWHATMSAMEPNFLGTVGRGHDIQAIQLCLAQPKSPAISPALAAAVVQSPPDALAAAKEIFSDVACIASLGGIAVACAESGGVACLGAERVLTLISCTLAAGGLGSLIPGEEDHAPTPGVPTIGPQNPPPPEWLPGGTSGPFEPAPGNEHGDDDHGDDEHGDDDHGGDDHGNG